MSETVYECMFILDANRYARDPGGMSGELAKLVEQNGGEVLASRLYNEQKLAYPIKGHRKGAYWLMYFKMDGPSVDAFRRACKIHDSILRELTLKIDSRLVDALVSRARGEEPDATETPEPATAAAGEGESKSPAAEESASKE